VKPFVRQVSNCTDGGELLEPLKSAATDSIRNATYNNKKLWPTIQTTGEKQFLDGGVRTLKLPRMKFMSRDVHQPWDHGAFDRSLEDSAHEISSFPN